MSEFVLFLLPWNSLLDNRRCNKHPGGPAAKMRRVRHYHIHVVGTRTHPVDVNAYSSVCTAPLNRWELDKREKGGTEWGKLRLQLPIGCR